MKTKPEIFIIETLDPDDEGNGRFEGGIISKILRLHGKSNYRYLHISAHADSEGMCTTNLDTIDYGEFAEIVNPHLKGRRIFLSACSMVHENIAKEIIPKSGCFSVVGPNEDILFTNAAILWSSLYHLLFSDDFEKINHKKLKEHLTNTSKMFGVGISYYSKSKKLKRGYTKDILRK